MPFFEFDSGHLVPAQVGRPLSEEADAEILQAVRDQILEVVQRPLFPVSWHVEGYRAGTYRPTGSASPRLTAMDPTGQVVTVEVVGTLDSGSLVAALSRSGRNAEMGWAELGNLYPRGAEAFRRDWNVFREGMPPRPLPGPRLVIVAGSVADEVRPALEVLGESGIVVHELALRSTGDGRFFVEVTEARPGQGAHPGPLLGRREHAVELGAQPQAGAQDVDDDRAPDEGSEPEPVEADGAADRPDRVLDLALVAAALEGDAPLVWAQLRRGIRHDAVLTADGMLRLPDGTRYDDPTAAAIAVSGRADVDGWQVWRFGVGGPSLAEARAEIAAVGLDRPAGRRSR